MQRGIGSSSSSDQREASEQASCCDPAAPCALPCGRLTEFWDPQLLLELSHHPAVERCHALGVHRLSRLLKLTATYMHIIRVFGDQLGMPGNCVLTKPSSSTQGIGMCLQQARLRVVSDIWPQWASGTVLAAEVKAADASLGYQSGAAREVVKRMAPHGELTLLQSTMSMHGLAMLQPHECCIVATPDIMPACI